MHNLTLVKVDVDGEAPLPFAEVVARLSRARYRLIWLRQRRSPGGHGWHLVLKVLPLPRTAIEIVALQLLMGSDPRRESYNLNRARIIDTGNAPHGVQWNVLYRE